ncbi:MAG: hypothetical protein ACJAXH_003499 [Colwellia sp.]|jgi:hypothetical protein
MHFTCQLNLFILINNLKKTENEIKKIVKKADKKGWVFMWIFMWDNLNYA